MEIGRLGALVSALLLVVFHLLLLGRRIRDGGLAEPLIAAKWLGTLALVGFVFWLRRRAPSWASRRTLFVGLWILVLALHAPLPGTTSAPSSASSHGSVELLLWLPASITLAGRWLGRRFSDVSLSTPHASLPHFGSADSSPLGSPAAAVLAVVAPRPPPGR